MLCEICGENKVSFIISMTINSEVKEIRVCEECATHDSKPAFSTKYVGSDRIGRKCPSCNSGYGQMWLRREPFLMGCPQCYDEFQEEITSLLRRIHGSTKHKGKVVAKKKRIGLRRKTKSDEQKSDDLRVHSFLGYRVFSPNSEAEWMQGNGPDCDVVVSSRIRLARNVDGYFFCNLADEARLREIAQLVESASESVSLLNDVSIIELENLNDIDREFLIERYLISRELAEKRVARKVIIGEREVASIMLNEEDHIRLQAIASGLQIRELWSMLSRIDDELGQNVGYAFSPELGYITACPTNIGTGLRVSVMFHIPALSATEEGRKILSSISGMGYAVRGMYGEGSRPIGAFYQISNEATLGQSEEEIIDSIQSISLQILELEREERKILMERNRIKIEDTVFRSYGTLTNARSISSRESLELLSWISFGVDAGILPGPSKTSIAHLLVLTRPAHLQKLEAKRLDALARDVNRASVIRAVLRNGYEV